MRLLLLEIMQQIMQGYLRALFLLALAEVYDPNLPLDENPAYVARSKELIQEREAQIFGTGQAFAQETDRGWAPPSIQDLEAEENRAVEG